MALSRLIAGLDLNLPLKIMVKATSTCRREIPRPAFRGEKNDGLFTVADFWFVRGVGSIKETVTQRSPSGDLLSRNAIELVKPPAPPRRTDRQKKRNWKPPFPAAATGDPLNVVSDDALQIVARWRGHGLRKNARSAPFGLRKILGSRRLTSKWTKQPPLRP